jgi:hypothetical protein
MNAITAPKMINDRKLKASMRTVRFLSRWRVQLTRFSASSRSIARIIASAYSPLFSSATAQE